MSTKKFLVRALLLVFISMTTYSQFYVKVSGSYGLSLSPEFMYNASLSYPEYEYVFGSFGEGIYPSLGVGYKINKNFAVEISGSYLIGRTYESQDSNWNEFGTPYLSTLKQKGNGIFINPSIIIMAPMKGFTPYAKFGGTIGIPQVLTELSGEGAGAPTGTYKVKESGNFALGVNGAGGVMFNAGKMLNIFAEVFGTGLTYKPKKRENTENYAGRSLDPEITYEESGRFEAPYSTAPSRIRPFSNYGLNIGIILNFGKAPKK